ncbi:MAG: hypothetical protein ACRDH9_10900 [Actinomycetota bacterium]
MSRPLTWTLTVLLMVSGACSPDRRPEGPSASLVNPAAIEDGPYAPVIDPADFVDVIDNPYMPLTPGTVLTYMGFSDRGKQMENLVVTYDTKEILGVTTTVIRDQVETKGVLTKDTFRWFAQDRSGNVWYFGQDSREIEHDRVASRSGSWEASVDGAQPGIVMPGHPQVGDLYRQEFSPGEAEAIGKVLRLDASVTVPHGSFHGVLVTEDRNPLEPNLVENKLYARGVGVLKKKRMVQGGEETLELVGVGHMDPPEFGSIGEAVTFIQSRMHLPIVLPAKLPRDAHLSIYNLVDVSRFEGRARAHLRIDFGVRGYLYINYGVTGFDGCGGDTAVEVDVLGQRGLLLEHMSGGATIIWPVPEGSLEGRYGLDSHTLPGERLLRMARSMERARAETKKEAFPGC